MYYRQDDTYVTDEWLVVAGRRYQVGQLDNLRTVRALSSRVTRGAAVVAVLVAVVILVLAQHLSSAAWIGVGILLAVPPVALARELVRVPCRYELWADYQGLTVQVMCGQSAEHVAGVRRALSLAQQ